MIIYDDVEFAERYIRMGEKERYNFLRRYPNLVKEKLVIYSRLKNLYYRDCKKLIETEYQKEQLRMLQGCFDSTMNRIIGEAQLYSVNDNYISYRMDSEFGWRNDVDEIKKITTLSIKEYEKYKEKNALFMHEVPITESELNWIISKGENNIQRKILFGHLYLFKYFNCSSAMSKPHDADINRLVGMNNNNRYKEEFLKVCSINQGLYKERNLSAEEAPMYCYDYGWGKDKREIIYINKEPYDILDEIVFSCMPYEVKDILEFYLPTPICENCGKHYIKKSNRQKFCPSCKNAMDNIKSAQRTKKWREQKRMSKR